MKFRSILTVAVAALGTMALGLTGSAIRGQTPATGSQPPAKKHVDPEINKQFQKGRVRDFVKRFESDDREVFTRRKQIVEWVGLKPGMAVADIGAGTGLFTRLFAEQVGSEGKVYAVDVSADFLKHIAAESKKRGQSQVVTLLGSQDTTNLAAGSVDVAFLCDVYHHLEHHEKTLASIHHALKPGGELILIEFDRVEGKSTDFVLKHIRASQSEFVQEIAAAGFQPVKGGASLKLKENFAARFRKADRPEDALRQNRSGTARTKT